MKKVFISYSYDSPSHERWVEQFAEDLSNSGINVILDKWDLRLGQDINSFMEDSIFIADRVLIICTDNYLRRSNKLLGGVGYEKNIMSSQLIKDLKTIKFIPVVREVADKTKLPNFLGNRLFVDLTEKSNYRKNLNWLISEINETHHKRNKGGIVPIELFPATKVKEKEDDSELFIKSLPGMYTDGLINVDYDDIFHVIENREIYFVKVTSHNCKNEAKIASECFLLCIKLASIEINSFSSVYINISANNSMTMHDFEVISEEIHGSINEDSNMILGLTIDENLKNILIEGWLGKS